MHGDARRRIDRAVEEQALGGEVVLHGLVVVEVVAREIGEDGHVEVDSGHASLVERVARDFGDEFGCAARHAFGHQLEQVARFGRGVDRRPHFAGHMIFNGADENRLARGGIQQRFGQKGRGGFAVGAGDSGGGELAFGMAEECGGSLGQRAAAVLDLEQRQARLIDGEVVEGRRGVGNDAERARGNGLLHVAIAVGRAALHGDKNAPGRTRRESYSMPVMVASELPADRRLRFRRSVRSRSSGS